MQRFSAGRPSTMAERVTRRKDRPLGKMRVADVEPLLTGLVDLGVNRTVDIPTARPAASKFSHDRS